MGWWENVKNAAAKVAAAAKAKLEAAKKLAEEKARELAAKAAEAARKVADAARKAAEAAARALAAKKAAETAAKRRAIELAEEAARAAARKVAEAARKVADALAESKRIADEKKKQAEDDVKAAEAKQKEIEEAETPEEVKWWDEFKAKWSEFWEIAKTEPEGIKAWYRLPYLGSLMRTLDKAEEKWGVKIPDWLIELGAWFFLMPAGLIATTAQLELKLAPATAAQLETMLRGQSVKHIYRAIREEPGKWGPRIAKLPKDLRAMVMKALSRSSDPTAYDLARDAIKAFETTKGLSTIQKSIGILPGKTTATKLFISLSTLVALVGSYIGYATFTAWTGKEALKESISFAGLYLFIDDKRWQEAKDHLSTLKTAIEAYEKATILTKPIPFVSGIWEEAIKNAWIEYNYYEELIDLNLAEDIIETDEEKWERIDEEKEEERLRIIKEDEERFEKYRDEAKVREDEATEATEALWKKRREDEEERHADKIIADEERWARYRDEAKIVEEEKIIAAEEYWEKVRAIEDEIREEEREYWEKALTPPKKSTIKINSSPQGAKLSINGEYLYVETPYTAFLEPGNYLIRLTKDDYYPEEWWITIKEDDIKTITKDLTKEIEPYVKTGVEVVEEPEAVYDYALLEPEEKEIVQVEELLPPTDKELLINIETTDVKPWEGRIYSIGLQDLSMPGSEPIVLINNSEENLINDFLQIFNTIKPKKLVGFKLIFDYRFIFSKMMLYRINNKSFKDIALRDIKQIMDQVKEEFVYFPSKIGSLDDWGKMLLGKGKYGAQELMLRKYIAGDFDYVKAFQLRQLELTKGLYDLSRFSASESLIPAIPALSPLEPLIPLIPTPAPQSNSGQQQCLNCFAYNPLDAKICSICGKELKGGEQNV